MDSSLWTGRTLADAEIYVPRGRESQSQVAVTCSDPKGAKGRSIFSICRIGSISGVPYLIYLEGILPMEIHGNSTISSYVEHVLHPVALSHDVPRFFEVQAPAVQATWPFSLDTAEALPQ
jgi:hypothetical protein